MEKAKTITKKISKLFSMKKSSTRTKQPGKNGTDTSYDFNDNEENSHVLSFAKACGMTILFTSDTEEDAYVGASSSLKMPHIETTSTAATGLKPPETLYTFGSSTCVNTTVHSLNSVFCFSDGGKEVKESNAYFALGTSHSAPGRSNNASQRPLSVMDMDWNNADNGSTRRAKSATTTSRGSVSSSSVGSSASTSFSKEVYTTRKGRFTISSEIPTALISSSTKTHPTPGVKPVIITTTAMTSGAAANKCGKESSPVFTFPLHSPFSSKVEFPIYEI